MTNGTVATYLMNPAEDMILFGEDLEEGMWVLPESPTARRPHGNSEDERIRKQRFRRVTRLRHEPASDHLPPQVIFVGEWVDGYQEVHKYDVAWGWLVKKAPRPDGPAS